MLAFQVVRTSFDFIKRIYENLLHHLLPLFSLSCFFGAFENNCRYQLHMSVRWRYVLQRNAKCCNHNSTLRFASDFRKLLFLHKCIHDGGHWKLTWLQVIHRGLLEGREAMKSSEVEGQNTLIQALLSTKNGEMSAPIMQSRCYMFV